MLQRELARLVDAIDGCSQPREAGRKLDGLSVEVGQYQLARMLPLPDITADHIVAVTADLVVSESIGGGPETKMTSRLRVSRGLTVSSRRGGVCGIAGTEGCTNLQFGHAGEDLQSMTRRWQLTHGTATIWSLELMLLTMLFVSSAKKKGLALLSVLVGVVEMLSSRFSVPCSSLDLGLSQLFSIVFLFRSRHCSQSRGRGSPSCSSRPLAWETASSQTKCFLFFAPPLLPSESDDELLGLFALLMKPGDTTSDVGPNDSSGCTSISFTVSNFTSSLFSGHT
ncbi:hypothetical protein EJB05_28289, partial [Eragrostis curvula]